MFTRAALLVVLSSVACGSAWAAEATPPPAPTIRVIAQANVSVKPDRAEFEVGVATSAKTASAASGANARAMEKVVAAVKKAAGAAGELTTSALSLEPDYQELRDGRGTQKLVGYKATNEVLVVVGDISAVGRIFDAALEAGANTVEGLTYALKDPEAAQNQALKAASAKARARATAMAEGQGLRVGDVVSVVEGAPSERPDYLELAMATNRRSANIVATPILAGTINVAAIVTVVYALKR
jgi:uncharacterized protein YggE